MKFLKLNILFIGFVALMFFIDRYTKTKIINLMENQNSLYINDFLNFNLVFNTGIGFGLLSIDNRIIYNFLTILILSIILILFFLMIKSNKKEKVFYSLIVGGAVGNLYDRIFYKSRWYKYFKLCLMRFKTNPSGKISTDITIQYQFKWDVAVACIHR